MRPGSVSPASAAAPQHVHGSSAPRLGGAAPGTTVSATQTSRSSSDSTGQPASSVPASDGTASEAEASTGSSPCATGQLGCISRYRGAQRASTTTNSDWRSTTRSLAATSWRTARKYQGAMPSDLCVQPFTDRQLLGAVLLPAFAYDRDVLAIRLEHAHDALVAGSRLALGLTRQHVRHDKPPPLSYGILLTKDERRYK